MRLVSFFLLVMLLGDATLWWGSRRALRDASRGWRWVIGAFFALQLAGLAAVLASRMGTAVELPRALLAAVYLWHCLFLLPALVVWLLATVSRRIWETARRPENISLAPPDSAIDRRQFLAKTLWAAPAVLTAGATVAASFQVERFRVRRLDVALPQLPPALDGLTIAHVSDLHVGRFTRGAVLERIVTTTNALAADLVLLTGDLINFALADLPVALDVLRALRAREGVFTCEGNHDLFESPREFRRRTAAAGVALLVNESASLTIRGERVQLLGLRWGGEGDASPHDPAQRGDAAIAASLRGLLRRRDLGAFPLLLAHHPHAFDFAEEIPLTLAGHTHGGQLMLTERIGFGPLLFRYWSGLYRRDDRALVVSNGTGNWFPLRTAAPAEIVHLTLRRTPVADLARAAAHPRAIPA